MTDHLSSTGGIMLKKTLIAVAALVIGGAAVALIVNYFNENH